MKRSKILKGTIELLLCAIFICTSMWIVTDQIAAMTSTGSGNHNWYSPYPLYLENSGTGIGAIGEAYVVGSDGLVQTSDGRGVHVDAYSVSEDIITVGGIELPSRYKISGNVQNLYNLHHSAAQGNLDANISWPGNIEYYQCEGEKLKVVAYDDSYVYYWSPGFKAYSGTNTYLCKQNQLLETHPAGFYKIKKSHVWLDIYSKREVAINTTSVGTAQIFGKVLPVHQNTDDMSSLYCYAFAQNTEIPIVSATPITGTDGEEYYKALIKGDNAVGYMGNAYYYVYINRKHVDFHDNKIAVPQDYSNAILSNIPDNKYLKVYSAKSKDSSIRAPYADGAKIKVYPDKSDSNWTCVWYENNYAYVPAKYISYYVDELYLKDVVNGKYVIAWRKVPVEVTISMKANYGGRDLGTITVAANKESHTVDSAVFKGYEGMLKVSGVVFTAKVSGTDLSGTLNLYYPETTSSLIARSIQNTKVTMSASWMGKDYGTILEYSTKKNFKNAKKIKPSKNYVTVKGLKKNKKYYFRYYNAFNIKTANGVKLVKGTCSKTLTVKTTNISVKKPSIKTPSGGKKSITIKWKKYTGQARYHEIVVATNKAFTKNVKRAKPTKSLTSIKISGLKAKKKYYVKMRTVYNNYGAEYKSGWTKVKVVTTK